MYLRYSVIDSQSQIYLLCIDTFDFIIKKTLMITITIDYDYGY